MNLASVDSLDLADGAGGGESAPSSMAASLTAKLTGVLASPFLIHVIAELVVIGGVSFYFYRRHRSADAEIARISNENARLVKDNTELNTRLQSMEQKLAEQSVAIQQITRWISTSQARNGNGVTGGSTTTNPSRQPQTSKVPAKSVTVNRPSTSSVRQSLDRQSTTPVNQRQQPNSSAINGGNVQGRNAPPTTTVINNNKSRPAQTSRQNPQPPPRATSRSPDSESESPSSDESEIDNTQLDAELESEYERMESTRGQVAVSQPTSQLPQQCSLNGDCVDTSLTGCNNNDTVDDDGDDESDIEDPEPISTTPAVTIGRLVSMSGIISIGSGRMVASSDNDSELSDSGVSLIED